MDKDYCLYIYYIYLNQLTKISYKSRGFLIELNEFVATCV